MEETEGWDQEGLEEGTAMEGVRDKGKEHVEVGCWSPAVFQWSPGGQRTVGSRVPEGQELKK
jgi:hypothetical protein